MRYGNHTELLGTLASRRLGSAGLDLTRARPSEMKKKPGPQPTIPKYIGVSERDIQTALDKGLIKPGTLREMGEAYIQAWQDMVEKKVAQR